ncbi:VOC family protein [Candidatus Enterococcus murrayae]|uniref:VOC family protein n=1 Tax=Candidatus Enterococcus murrayae TaxID=2815321 RepID=A0ABS3HD28_9ENTE|nr:VOC family protein [Enterococcus sp. MJM16]MBO0451351.1 VOC family protein [Enterococcus sp. MJM16]
MSSFHHISLLTKDRHENVRFYTEILGLRFVKNTVNQENHRMLHYYYGDYQGTPGSVVTFFIVPHLGHRYEKQHFISTIGLKLPRNSLSYWKERLKHYQVPFTSMDRQLRFFDADQVDILLTETDQPPLALSYQVANEIPAEKQILGLNSSQIHVREPKLTSTFFETFLGWKTVDQRIHLNGTDFFEILPTESDEPSRMGRGSADHIAFAVANETELNELYHRAEKQGWQIEKMVSRGYFKSLYIREPGGNRIEFATLSPGFTIDEPLDSLGKGFVLPPFLAEQRTEIEAALYPDS